MIIRRHGADLLFITQPDHAHLAHRVMGHCAALREHPRAASVLLAVAEHDNGWREVDAVPFVDASTQQPLDFINVPAEVRQDIWPRGVERLAFDPWAAALVANHAVVVYDRYRGDPAWKSFFPTMEGRRDDLLRDTGGRMEDLIADYRFVRLGDLISLVFCTGWTEPQQFDGWTIGRSNNDVIVSPVLFAGGSVPCEIAAKQLPAASYATGDEFRRALESAPAISLRGEIRG